MLNASCPLCKRALVRRPTDGPPSSAEQQPAAADGAAPAPDDAPTLEPDEAGVARPATPEPSGSEPLRAVVVESPGAEMAPVAAAASNAAPLPGAAAEAAAGAGGSGAGDSLSAPLLAQPPSSRSQGSELEDFALEPLLATSSQRAAATGQRR